MALLYGLANEIHCSWYMSPGSLPLAHVHKIAVGTCSRLMLLPIRAWKPDCLNLFGSDTGHSGPDRVFATR